MRLGLLTSVSGRPELTQIVLRHNLEAAEQALDEQPFPMAVLDLNATPHDFDGFTWGDGWRYIRGPSEPVSAKLQKGLEEMRGRVDAVMLIDTDNLIHRRYFSLAESWISADMVDFMYLRGGHFLNLVPDHPQVGELLYLRPFTMGPGMTISARALDFLDWNIWTDERNRLLNSPLLERFNTYPGSPRTTAGDVEYPFSLEIKTGEQITTWDETLRGIPGSRITEVQQLDRWLEEHYLETAPFLSELITDE